MTELPNLIIQHEKFNPSHHRYNLKRLLYKGSAGLDARFVFPKIENGELGEQLLDRLELLQEIKAHIETRLICGSSPKSMNSYLTSVVGFFKFIDQSHHLPKLSNLSSIYVEYSEYLFIGVHEKPRRLSMNTAYSYAASLSRLFGNILDIPVEQNLIQRTRLKYEETSKKAVSKSAEKQNLEDTFKAGAYLVDLIDGLTVESIFGELPLRIPIRSKLIKQDNMVFAIGLWPSVDKSIETDVNKKTSIQKTYHRNAANRRKPVDSLNGTQRWYLVNLRVTAEFLVFIAQTGMNTTQAVALKRRRFAYKAAADDSFSVRAYKNRAGGEVLFTIYRSYKARLSKHLSFINYFFPDSELLFPRFGINGESTVSVTQYDSLRSHLKLNQIPWIPPKTLRNTRVNWLLRRSGDEEITSEMAQHTKEVLKANYERPSQQRAMVETTRFWNQHDPIRQCDLKEAPIGQCSGNPEPVDTKPASVVVPNCLSQSGCLWCKHHRDLDTADYVWSLCSMRHLKTIEATLPTRKEIPADVVIDRITEKLDAYRIMSDDRAQWVSEAELRIQECHYHTDWSPLIEFVE